MTDRVCVGVVVGAHGIKGAVRVKSFTEDPADLVGFGPVEDEAGRHKYQLTMLGESKGLILVRMAGVADRNAAEALKGVKLWVPKAALPQPEEEEYFYSDLIGMRAERADGAEMGRVKGVFDFGGGVIIEIEGPGGAVMLPFTRAVVPLVDVAGKRLVIEPPDEVEVRLEGEEEGEDGE